MVELQLTKHVAAFALGTNNLGLMTIDHTSA